MTKKEYYMCYVTIARDNGTTTMPLRKEKMKTHFETLDELYKAIEEDKKIKEQKNMTIYLLTGPMRISLADIADITYRIEKHITEITPIDEITSKRKYTDTKDKKQTISI